VTKHRADLVDLLRAAEPERSLRPGTEVHDVRPDGTVVHSGGTSTADLVVGADGVHSVTRRSVWPRVPGPRYVGYTAWRLVTVAHPVDGNVEVWGRGERVGYQPLPDGRIYCYVIVNAPAGSHGGLEELRDRFARWPDPVPALLRSARPEDLVQHDAFELPGLRTYVSGRVALLGDAAHAMTPNLGQGACQALEDAVTLAAVVDRLSVPEGLAAYDRARRPHTQRVVRLSHRVCAPAHWTSAALTRVRDRVVPLVPRAVIGRSLGPIYSWTA
ncbi:MAG: FAD-dependent monooxygenase, partial [Pseudonocardia sp.]